jgi:hypothetical protein
VSDSIYDWARRSIDSIEKEWPEPLDIAHLSALQYEITKRLDVQYQEVQRRVHAAVFAVSEEKGE